MKEMEKSILEAGGETGRVYDSNKTHSITEKEHQFFLEWQEANRRQEEKEKENK